MSRGRLLSVVRARCSVLLLAMAGALAAACTAEAPTEPVSPFTGTWILTTVNGAPLPFTLETALNGARRQLIDARIVARSGGRLYDIKHMRWTDGTGEVVDTVVSPFSATEVQLLVRRYALLSASDWVDTGAVAGGQLELRARYIEQQFGPVRNARMVYLKAP